jgi:phospholipase C
MEVVNLLQNQPKLFGTFQQFKKDCEKNALPQYSFIEPNYSDHDTDGGEQVANDQHPDHDVQAGEGFIAEVYMHIRKNPQLWPNTALLVVYDEHGGIYDHVPPPACTPDKFPCSQIDPGTGKPFDFSRLGVRVPAILISPWIATNTVVDRIFDHASIPGTVQQFFIGDDSNRSPREVTANLFIEKNPPAGDPSRNLLSLSAMRNDCPTFDI